MRAAAVTASWLVSATRLGSGVITSQRLGPRPEKPLVLYEFEACPFCRKVREALTFFDLEAEIRPCPKKGTRFRPTVKELSGVMMFPFLVDPNTDTTLNESNAITRYLAKTYGTGSRPLGISCGPLTDLSSAVAGVFRPLRGMQARASIVPEQSLELWSFEGSPYCRLVREVMSELELPYILHNVGKTSPSRNAFKERSGRMMVPYLADPNTGTEMFESGDIIDYLNDQYAA